MQQRPMKSGRWISLLMLASACGGSEPPPTTWPPPGSGMVLPPNTVGAAGTVAPTSMVQPPPIGAATGTAGTGSIVPPGPAPTGTPVGVAGTGGPAAGGGGGPDMPMGCQGFKLEGLLYSPGGTVLPNTCMPFHHVKNNPYAVRCIDAWSWYKTKFPGDEFCILPPAPDKGIQYGVHPQGSKWFDIVSKGDVSGYENLSTDWTMSDGEEESANYETRAGNTAKSPYYRSYARMRPGSHHMIVNSDAAKPGDDRWYPVSEGGLLEGAAGLIGAVSLPGAQRPDESRPPSFEKPAEDAGLFRELPANAKVTFNMHHFNASGKTILKETWTNMWWEQDAKNPIYGLSGLEVGQVFTMAIPPGDTQDFHYSWNIAQPVRLVEAFGHRHAWTSNFSAWIQNRDGSTEIVYQSFAWLDEPTYRYDSVTQNPKPAPQARTDGAFTGVKTLMPGQKLHFNCHIEFTPERATTEKAPTPNQIGTLRFANEAFTGEMCILFGATAVSQLGAPGIDTSPLPDFATID